MCELEAGPVGTFSVRVAVKGKGAALWNSVVDDFEYTATITAINPLTAGHGGKHNSTLFSN